MSAPPPEVATRDLEQVLGRVLGGGAPVAVRERRPLAYRSTFPLEELRLLGAGGGEEWLVWKDLSHRGPRDPVWSVKPFFVRDPRREAEVYRELLAPAGISAPRFLGAHDEPLRGRHWLFLERVDGDLLWQRGDDEAWRATARWLAALHARFAHRAQQLPRRLLRHDAAYHRRWLRRARCFGGDRVARLEAGAERAAAWLEGQPATLVHGELYPSNVLVEEGADGPRIRPLDWEMAGAGPGLLDLAALVSGAWSERDRALVCDAYRRALPAGLRPPERELRDGVDRCRLLLAVQWLGWSPRWTPPPEHAEDWLGTALELAEQVPA